MSSTQEVDAFDNILGVFRSIAGRFLVWSLCGYVAFGFGYLALLRAEDIAQLAVQLPRIWLLACFACCFHWIGLLYLPTAFIGGAAFMTTEDWTHKLFFWHLVIAPWAALPTAVNSSASLNEAGGLLILGWDAVVILAWYIYNRWAAPAPYRAKDHRKNAAVHGTMMSHRPVIFPEYRYGDKLVPPTSENLRLPSTTELRESLNLGPEPPPDIDTANLK
jgi:hypothetical protein